MYCKETCTALLYYYWAIPCIQQQLPRKSHTLYGSIISTYALMAIGISKPLSLQNIDIVCLLMCVYSTCYYINYKLKLV